MKGILALAGFGFGAIVAAGVFTVLLATGMITRFAGKAALASKIRWFENMVVLGTILGSFAGVFQIKIQGHGIGIVFLCIYGLFAGIFVGCLAMTIAEVLDAIPIFARRIGYRKGLEWAILSIAIGKTIGSLFYFLKIVT